MGFDSNNTNVSKRSVLKVWKRGKSSLKVRQRKAEKHRELKNKATMRKLEQKWEDIKLSFTDQAPQSFNPTTGKSIIRLNDDISVVKTGPMDYMTFEDSVLLSFDSPSPDDTFYDDCDFSIYPDFEELYEQLPPKDQWSLLQHEGTVTEIYEECKRLHALHVETISNASTEVQPTTPPTSIVVPTVETSSVEQQVPHDIPISQPTLSKPILKPHGYFIINGNNFMPSTGHADYSENFGTASILIYAGPGCGKSVFRQQYPEYSHIFTDADNLTYGIDGKQVILTSRIDLLVRNPQMLTIAFLPHRLLWDARCVTKCGKEWQPNWYPIDLVRHAHIVFTGTGYVSDYFKVV